MKYFCYVLMLCVLSATPLAISEANANGGNKYISEGIDAAEQGNCPRAYSLFEKAIAISPNEYQVYYVTGMTYMRCGEAQKARQFLERAITLAKQKAVQDKYSAGDIAVAYATLSDYGNAKKYGEEALKLFIEAGETSRANKMRAFLSSIQKQ